MQKTLRMTDATVEKAIRKGLLKLNLTQDQVTVHVIEEGKKGLFGFGQKDAIVELTVLEGVSSQDSSQAELINPAPLDGEVSPLAQAEAGVQAPSLEQTQEVKEEEVFESSEGTTLAEKGDQEGDGAEPVAKPEEVLEAASLPEQGVEDQVEEDWEEESFGPAMPEEEFVTRLEQAAVETKAYLEAIAQVYGAPSTVTVEARRDAISFVFESEKPGLLIGKHGKILNALQILAQVKVHQYVSGKMSVQVDVGDYRERRTQALELMAEKTAQRVLKTRQAVYLEPLPAYERKQIHAYLSRNKKVVTHSEGKEPHRYLVVDLANK